MSAQVEEAGALAPVTVAEDSYTSATREESYDRFVRDNFRRNYTANYVHGMLGMTGFRLLYAPTLLPAYLHMITGSAALVGAGQALLQIGAIVSPIVGASRIEKLHRVMPTAVRVGGLMRVQILGLAVSAWLLTGMPLLAATFGFLFLLGVFTGSQRVIFQALMSKVIPIEQRGRLQAWRNFTGGVIAAGLSYVAGVWFIGHEVLGNGYATTFMLAFILTAIGLWVLQRLLVEPEALTVVPSIPFRQRLGQFPALLADRSYRNFLIAQVLTIAARAASPFYVLYIGRTIPLDGKVIGLLSLAFLGADTVTNLIWGAMGDKTGFRRVFILSSVVWIGGVVLLMMAETLPMVVVAYLMFGAAMSGYLMASTTIVLEFGERQDIPMRLALSTTAEGLVSTVGLLSAGLIAAVFGYGSLLWLALATLTAGLLVIVFAVRDPRFVRSTSV
ncbi:MFS transporter [Brevundimonas sp.]|uniref:MFS transporter n=1 Tax=Brevundimonas sp. TaxID=1871086 RepID=UPI00289F1A76|nr:MFS transporter [Brevundimonas sp.]